MGLGGLRFPKGAGPSRTNHKEVGKFSKNHSSTSLQWLLHTKVTGLSPWSAVARTRVSTDHWWGVHSKELASTQTLHVHRL